MNIRGSAKNGENLKTKQNSDIMPPEKRMQIPEEFF